MLIDTLLNAKAEAWLGVMGVVVGALLSIFGTWLTMRSNLQQAKLKLEYERKVSQGNLRRERLEELHVLVSAWGKEFFSNYMSLDLVMKGHQSYNDYLDDFISKERNVDFSRIEMIVDIYGRGLLERYGDVLEARYEVNKVNGAHKNAYRRGESGEKFVGPAADAQLRLGDTIEELKLAIAVEARVG